MAKTVRPLTLSTKSSDAAMRAHQLVRDGEAEAGAAAARRAAEGGEEVFARLLRQAGSGVR